MRFTHIASLAVALSFGFAAAAIAQQSPAPYLPGQTPGASNSPHTSLYGYGTPNYGGYYRGESGTGWGPGDANRSSMGYNAPMYRGYGGGNATPGYGTESGPGYGMNGYGGGYRGYGYGYSGYSATPAR